MPKTPRPAPVPVRMGDEKRARLKSEAGALGMSVNAYIIWRVFDSDQPLPAHRRTLPKVDHVALSAFMAKLSASRLPNNLNQLAKALNSGSLVLTPEIEAELREAVETVAAMRRMLIEALGLSEAMQ